MSQSDEEQFDGQIETEEVSLGYLLMLRLYADIPMTVTVIQYEEEDGQLQRIGPIPLEGQEWRYPFVDNEEGLILRANDGREGIYLVRHGHIYQIGGSLRLNYTSSFMEMREVSY